VSRDPLLYVADIVAAGEASLRYTEGVTFDAFASNDEKPSAVERQVSSRVKPLHDCRRSGSCSDPKCRGGRSWACAIFSRTGIG
jgi:hypothetical protein